MKECRELQTTRIWLGQDKERDAKVSKQVCRAGSVEIGGG